MQIGNVYNSGLGFQSLNIKRKGFEKCPELADSIVEKFCQNKNVDAFVKENDVDVTIEKKKDGYTFSMKVDNPHKTGGFTDIFRKNKLKVTYSGNDICRNSEDNTLSITGEYFNEKNRSYNEEYGPRNGFAGNGFRPSERIYVRNINEDIENLEEGKVVTDAELRKENKKANKKIKDYYKSEDSWYWDNHGCNKYDYTASAGGN